MKSTQEFDSFYHNQLLPQLEVLEPMRKKVVRQFILPALLCIVSFCTFVFFWPVGIFFFILTFFMFSRYRKAKRAYTGDFKKQVMGELIQFISLDLTYQPLGCIQQSTFQRSRIFLSSIDRYEGDDLVSGKINHTSFMFSDLNVMRKEVYYEKGQRKERWVRVFKGIFFTADFNKNFQGCTYVLPDRLESWLGRLGKKLQKLSRSEPLVSLENPEFEKHFVVYGTDQIEARYILTPSFMERIVALRKLLNKSLYFSFVDSLVCIAIPFTKNSFEPAVFSKGTRIEYLKNYFTQLQSVLGIIEELNLNIRIWTKE